MKQLFLIIVFLIDGELIHSQTSNERDRQRLSDEIRNCNYFESWCLGFACNSISELYRKADSLFTLSDLQNAVTYFNDSSYSLKYYSFLFILDRNDSIAFRLLKQNIQDKNKIDYQFADMFSNARFIKLIAYEYWKFIEIKYKYGGNVFLGGHRRLSFPPKNKKKYKRKNSEFLLLMKKNNIDLK